MRGCYPDLREIQGLPTSILPRILEILTTTRSIAAPMELFQCKKARRHRQADFGEFARFLQIFLIIDRRDAKVEAIRTSQVPDCCELRSMTWHSPLAWNARWRRSR